MVAYNGDEVAGVVVDFGTSTSRAGYSGEDCPKVVCPTSYGYIDVPAPSGDVDMAAGASAGPRRDYYVGENGAPLWRAGQEVGNMMQDGVIHDPAALPHLFTHMLHDRLAIDPREHPLLVTEPAWNTRQARDALTELAFEQEQVPAFYIACQSVLSAFAAGKGTALILDVGHDLASAVPVSEGYAMRAGTMRQPLAAGLLKSQLKAHFAAPHPPHRNQAVDLSPHQLLSKRQPRADRVEGTTQSWRDWAEGRVVEDWIEGCAEVMAPRGYDRATASSLPPRMYEFPNGQGYNFGEERTRYPEILFNPKHYFDQSIPPPPSLTSTPSTPASHSLSELVSLSQLVHDSVNACDVDIRPGLLQNVVVVGGGSLIPGLLERLEYDLGMMMPGQRVKIHAPGVPSERRFSSWLGGSILSSLGTFHQLWVGKQEYEEHGINIVHQRCK